MIDPNDHDRFVLRRRFDPCARYDVTAPGGEKVGEIQKVFGASLLRSTFTLHGAEAARARERNLPVPHPGRHLDRRLVLAVALCMDALQAR
jgi:hypothetical protein